MLNDPLASALSNILNCEKKGKVECVIKQWSKLTNITLSIMKKEGYIENFTVIGDKKKIIRVNLIGKINKCGTIKPHFSVKKTDYEKYEKRYLPGKNLGILVISTPKGIMTHHEAFEKGFGGRLIAYCF